ncbi:MAG: hypothetical protein F6J93_24965 [Oscillatoria sp. SIO1A7]|nr:hypothetical protein [Oscillatoria sp. SIO1A7]
MKSQANRLPLALIVAGVLFSLCLFFQITGEVYFSGDGGIKALLAKQFASGNLSFDLQLPAAPWVQELWNNGLYPFEPPFSYKQGDAYYITYSFTFPLVTAPFYALFGWRGLYIIPLAATWILWGGFYWVCQHLKLGAVLTSLALATLIFASPVSIYSATYWEHTLALCLAFNGLAILLVRGSQGFSNREAALSGILIGLSVWFRPEFLCLVAILLGLAAASYAVNLGYLNLISTRKNLFVVSLVIAILGFFALNLIIYNHPLGIHSIQVVEKFSLRSKLYEASKLLPQLKASLLNYFPILYFTFVCIGLSIFTEKIKLNSLTRQLVLIALVFTYMVPLLVPSDGGKQWGPRFLLIVVPLICLVAIAALQSTWKVKRLGLRYVSLALFTIFFVQGVHVNTYSALVKFSKQGFLSVLNLVREYPNQVVAVPHQYVGQSLAATFGEKVFFLTKDSDNLIELGKKLQRQGYKNFMYICPIYDNCFKSDNMPTLQFNLDDKYFQIEFSEISRMERYIFYEGSVNAR